MKGIILAGGYATRLHPLTETQPKHLLPILDIPMINHLLEELFKADVEHYYLITNDKFYQNFVDWLGSVHPEWKTRITVVNDGTLSNEERLGSIGCAKFVVDKFGLENDDLFIIGADNITDFDFNSLLECSKSKVKPAVGTYNLKDLSLVSQFGVVTFNDEGKILSFVEKPSEPTSTHIGTCFYVVPAEFQFCIQNCIDTGRHDKAGELVVELLEHTEVYAVTHDGMWFDIGSHETYKEAQEYFDSRK